MSISLQYIKFLKSQNDTTLKNLWTLVLETDNRDLTYNSGIPAVQELAQRMQQVDTEYLLNDIGKGGKWDVSLVRKRLDILRDDNFLCTFLNQSFSPGSMDQTTPWFDIPYSNSSINRTLLTTFEKNLSALTKAMALPPTVNSWLPVDFSLAALDAPFVGVSDAWSKSSWPVVLRNVTKNSSTDAELLWWRQDTFFSKTPQIKVRIEIHTPVASSSVLNYVMTDSFLSSFDDSLSRLENDAISAGYTFSAAIMSEEYSGISITISGYSHYMTKWVDTVLSHIRNWDGGDNITKANFEARKSAKKNQYQQIVTYYPIDNFYLPYLVSVGLNQCLLGCGKQGDFTLADLARAYDHVTYEKMNAHAKKIFVTYASQTYVNGNANRAWALGMHDILHKHLRPANMSGHGLHVPHRQINMTAGHSYVIKSTNPNARNTDNGTFVSFPLPMIIKPTRTEGHQLEGLRFKVISDIVVAMLGGLSGPVFHVRHPFPTALRSCENMLPAPTQL